ncbi:MvaI/BcnI family restriction endonuclease [Variovorax sp. VaC1]|uniref:MvaI/BcnI family restriction endonuclease n=1 Tax=Variovorax sp. VaC1 TaxID=3373132 RepID=UPI0037481397
MLGVPRSPLEVVADVMRKHGATRIFFKLLSNNDNSKQQIYFGGDFDVLRIIPHGEMSGEVSSRDGTVFKAPLNLSWLPSDLVGSSCPAPGAQLIFYPRYPEVRMSGFLRGCPIAPNHLMHAPTFEERALRIFKPRCLILGVCSNDRILAFAGAWDSDLSRDAVARIEDENANNIASVFYELQPPLQNSRLELINRLRLIYQSGAIPSQKMGPSGVALPYAARNGAGYTLESKFGIIPNGSSEPDFMGWELKAHSGAAVTLMTPEPDVGSYRDDLGQFLTSYGRSSDVRRDFTGRHQTGIICKTTSLILQMEGYDPHRVEITDPNGGLFLRDHAGKLAAGWTFKKLVGHWSKKHAQTAYVTYKKSAAAGENFYSYGPQILLGEGAELQTFLRALYSGSIYYDPGIKQTFEGTEWRSKKRNQFRVGWKNVGGLYRKSVFLTL